MSALRRFFAHVGRRVRMYQCQARITQLRQLLARPDLMLHPDALHRSLYEARLAALRCELHALEQQR